MNFEIKLKISPVSSKKEEEKMKKKRTEDERKNEEMNERQRGSSEGKKEDRSIDRNGEIELKRIIVISVEIYHKIKDMSRDRNRVPLS